MGTGAGLAESGIQVLLTGYSIMMPAVDALSDGWHAATSGLGSQRWALPLRWAAGS